MDGCFDLNINRVVALEMSPLDDQFLSAAMDDTVRLWDLRSSACQVGDRSSLFMRLVQTNDCISNELLYIFRALIRD